MFRFPKINLKKLGKFLGWTVFAIFSFYLAISLLVLPVASRWVVEHKVSEIVKHPLYLKKVKFNPFLLRLTLCDFEIVDPQLKTDMLSFDRFYVDLSFWDLFKKTIRIESLEMVGLYVNPVLSSEGRLNLLSLIPEPENQVNQSEKTEQDIETSEDASPKIKIDCFRLVNAAIHVEDQSLSRPFKHTIRPVNMEITNFSTILNELSDLKVTFFVGKKGRIIIDGDVNVFPLKIALKLASKEIELSAIQPYLEPYVNLKIAEGEVGFWGELVFDGVPDAKEMLQFNGAVNLTNFKIMDSAGQYTLLGFKDLILSPIDFSLNKESVTLGTLAIDGLESDIVLTPQGTNLDTIVKPVPAADTVQMDNPPSLGVEATENSDSDALMQGEDVTSNSEQFVFSLEKIQLTDGRVLFQDQTLDPAFDTALENIRVDIGGISSDKNCQVNLDFKGDLQDKGNLEMLGSLKPYSEKLDVNLSFRLNNYLMKVLTPYVGKFTGLAVEDGKLNLNIDYAIADNLINANHKLTINKFDFGEKVESEDALKLPFKLAVSLLKDMSGKILITLPVKGSLDDPEFKYMHMVGKVFTNFILKIVTKPFSFLASIAGGGEGEEELSCVRFQPGESTLDPAEHEKLIKLATAFNERPLLALKIHGIYDSESDWWAIKSEAFKDEYALRRDESTRSDAKVLEAFYKKKFGNWMYREVYQNYQSKEFKTDPSQKYSDFHQELKRQLIENAPADKAALDALAQKRATVVQEIFKDQGISENRIQLGESKSIDIGGESISMEFSLVVEE